MTEFVIAAGVPLRLTYGKQTSRMKYLACIFIALAALCTRLSAAGASSPQELIGVFEQAVQLSSRGNVAEGVALVQSYFPTARAPKANASQVEKFKELFNKIRDIGVSRQINKVSAVYYGDAYCRVRFLDTRENGYVLWTFFGVRVDDRWHATAINVSANSELTEIMKELDTADASKELPKPESN